MSDPDHEDPSSRDPIWTVESGARTDDAADLAEMGVITVGDLLGTTARAVGARFPQFLAIAVLVMLPAIATNVAATEWMQAAQERLQAGTESQVDIGMIAVLAGFGNILLQTALQFLAHAALMFGAIEYMAGRRATVVESLAGGFASIGSVLALAFLNTLAIGAATLACLIPGIIVTCVLFASVPAAVTERLGPIDAMQRSADLTHGHRLTIFLALLVLGLVWFTFACFGGIGLVAANGIADPAHPSLGARVAQYAFSWVLTIFVTIFQAALAAVFYARVRGVRDGVDADAIAKVFE